MSNYVRLLRLRVLMERFSRSRSSIYADIDRGVLTPPIRAGRRCAAWPESEIDQIIRARISGKNESEVKALVRRLVAARATADKVVA